MKITIELSKEEAKGIKWYLEANGDPSDRKGIQRFIQNIVSGNINNPRESVSDYIMTTSPDDLAPEGLTVN